MKFICLGYADEGAWDRMSRSELDAAMEECFAYDDVLRGKGHSWMGGEALQGSRTARTLRWKGDKVVVTDGPYAETKEQLGGFGVLEAKDIDHAVELMSKHPGIRYGPFEIRPAVEGACAEMSAAAPEAATVQQPHGSTPRSSCAWDTWTRSAGRRCRSTSRTPS